MSIVLNELEWAKNAIYRKELGSKPIETLTRVAKYYIDCGYSSIEARKHLEEFLISCDPVASTVLWTERIDSIMKYVSKHPLIIIDSVNISSNEIESIKSLNGIQTQRLAFTLLCIAKYNHIINEKNEYWVNTPDSEIMKMANIGTSIKRQSLLFSQLKDTGLIKFSKSVDNLSVQVLFIDDADVIMKVTDFRNLGYQYLKFIGSGNFYECANCGITFKCTSNRGGRPRKYCDPCAVKVRTKQRIDSVMRLRAAAKSEKDEQNKVV